MEKQITKPERPVFDLEKVHDEQISPLMGQIIDICKKHNMPMVASFCYKSNSDGSDCCTTAIPMQNGWQLPEFSMATSIIKTGILAVMRRGSL